MTGPSPVVFCDRLIVGSFVGMGVGTLVGSKLRLGVGATVGILVGSFVGFLDGAHAVPFVGTEIFWVKTLGEGTGEVWDVFVFVNVYRSSIVAGLKVARGATSVSWHRSLVKAYLV